MDNNNVNIPNVSNSNPQVPNNQNMDGVSTVSVPTVQEQQVSPSVEPPKVSGPVVAPPTVGNSDLRFNEEDGKILVPFGLDSIQPVNSQPENAPVSGSEQVQNNVEQPSNETVLQTQEVVPQPQGDGVLENVKMEKVEINYTPPSAFKKFIMFFMFIVLLGSIIFMPEINKFVASLKNEKKTEVVEEEIMNGTLSCSYQTNNEKFDLMYSGVFDFSNRELNSLTYTLTTKGDQVQDSTALQNLYDNCKNLSTDLSSKSYGVKVACDLSGGTVRIDESIDYSEYNSEVEQLFKKYDISLADFEAKQNIGDIENQLKHDNYICFMESKSE